LAAYAQIFLGGAIDEAVAQGRNVLDDDRRRHVLDDHVEEVARVLQLAAGPAALGDVLVRGDPAAVRHRLIDDGHDAAVIELDLQDEAAALAERFVQFLDVAVGIERERSRGDAGIEQVAAAAADPDRAGTELVHVDVALVPHHQPVVGIEHAEALHHVVQGAFEQQVLFEQLAAAAPGGGDAGRTDTYRDENRAGGKACGRIEPRSETENPQHGARRRYICLQAE